MKKILILLLLIIPIAGAVEITDYINDYAQVLPAEEEQQIEPILIGLKDQGLAEFAIVTVDSLEGRDIEGYAYELAEGVLGDKEKNNGLLLLVAINDRKYRFEVGRGLEPVLPDGKIGRVGRTYLVENFKKEQYGKGIKEAVLAIQAILTQNIESEYYVEEQEVPKNVIIGFLIFMVIFIILMIVAIRSSLKGKGRSDGDYFMAAWVAGNMMRGGRGGIGGGFGGFGGGSFGGGGAGGSWRQIE